MLRNRLSDQELLVANGKQEKEQIMMVIKELETRERSFRRRNNDFQNQLHKFDLLINQKTLELENIQNNLNEDYGLEWLERVDPNWTSPLNASAQIDQLKEELKELGLVNLAAIEDYQQVRQRFDFLTEQSQDLINAKDSLLKVISEIERTIVKRFNETFLEVKIQFRRSLVSYLRVVAPICFCSIPKTLWIRVSKL